MGRSRKFEPVPGNRGDEPSIPTPKTQELFDKVHMMEEGLSGPTGSRTSSDASKKHSLTDTHGGVGIDDGQPQNKKRGDFRNIVLRLPPPPPLPPMHLVAVSTPVVEEMEKERGRQPELRFGQHGNRAGTSKPAAPTYADPSVEDGLTIPHTSPTKKLQGGMVESNAHAEAARATGLPPPTIAHGPHHLIHNSTKEWVVTSRGFELVRFGVMVLNPSSAFGTDC